MSIHFVKQKSEWCCDSCYYRGREGEVAGEMAINKIGVAFCDLECALSFFENAYKQEAQLCAAYKVAVAKGG